MVFLLLSILSSASLFVIFKLLEKFKIPVFNAIVINYIVATALGFSIDKSNIGFQNIVSADWFMWALIIGSLFISFFYIIAISAQRVGITITTVASKMSVLFPIVFSIIFHSESLGTLKVLGISSALIAVLLAVYKKDSKKVDKSQIYLPIVLFVGAGFIDTIIKYCQASYISDELSPVFTASLFMTAASIGVIISLFKTSIVKQFTNWKVWLWGIILGLGNYGSIYFLILALNQNIFDSSILFGINNIGIVSVSTIIGLLVFTEKLSKVNWIGIFIAILAIFTLSIA